MLEFIVMGEVPGTSIQLTFRGVLLTALILFGLLISFGLGRHITKKNRVLLSFQRKLHHFIRNGQNALPIQLKFFK